MNMFRGIYRVLVPLLILAATGSGLLFYHEHYSVEHKLELAEQRAAQLEKRAEELQEVVARLKATRRVAKILVTDQTESAGVLRTTLLFMEMARDGTPLAKKYFTIEGKRAHIDALVIKFDGKFVEQQDALRGQSIALFTRLFGEHQDPAHAFLIDEPGHIPAIYRGAPESVSRFERELWANFWKLADDPDYREQMGVRIAQGESPWRDFDKNWLYTLSIDANGGVNLTNEKMEPIFEQAISDLSRGDKGAGSAGPVTAPASP